MHYARWVHSVQSYVICSDVEVMGGKLGPGACVEVSDAIDNHILRVVGMAAGNCFKTVFDGTINRIQRDVLSQDPVKRLPFFGIFRHVHRFGSQLDSQIVHQFESFYEPSAAGHDFIKIVPMGD